MLAYVRNSKVRDGSLCTNCTCEELLLKSCNSARNITNFGSDVTRLEAITLNGKVKTSEKIALVGTEGVDDWDGSGVVASLVVV